MAPLSELISKRDELNSQIAARQAEARAETVAKAQALLAEAGLTPADLMPRRSVSRPSSGIPVKYRNADGATWTGRGLQPVWLRTALALGATIDQFKV